MGFFDPGLKDVVRESIGSVVALFLPNRTEKRIPQSLTDLVEVQKGLLEVEKESLALQREATEILKKVYKKTFGLPRPGLFSITVTKEEGSMLLFDVGLPAVAESSDVVGGTVVVTVDGVAGEPVTFTREQTSLSGFKGNDNSAVSVSLTHTDDAGNVSDPRVVEATLADTIKPPVPGEFAINVTGEE